VGDDDIVVSTQRRKCLDDLEDVVALSRCAGSLEEALPPSAATARTSAPEAGDRCGLDRVEPDPTPLWLELARKTLDP
jgi:hypothetical protein